MSYSVYDREEYERRRKAEMAKRKAEMERQAEENRRKYKRAAEDINAGLHSDSESEIKNVRAVTEKAVQRLQRALSELNEYSPKDEELAKKQKDIVAGLHDRINSVKEKEKNRIKSINDSLESADSLLARIKASNNITEIMMLSERMRSIDSSSIFKYSVIERESSESLELLGTIRLVDESLAVLREAVAVSPKYHEYLDSIREKIRKADLSSNGDVKGVLASVNSAIEAIHECTLKEKDADSQKKIDIALSKISDVSFRLQKVFLQTNVRSLSDASERYNAIAESFGTIRSQRIKDECDVIASEIESLNRQQTVTESEIKKITKELERLSTLKEDNIAYNRKYDEFTAAVDGLQNSVNEYNEGADIDIRPSYVFDSEHSEEQLAKIRNQKELIDINIAKKMHKMIVKDQLEKQSGYGFRYFKLSGTSISQSGLYTRIGFVHDSFPMMVHLLEVFPSGTIDTRDMPVILSINGKYYSLDVEKLKSTQDSMCEKTVEFYKGAGIIKSETDVDVNALLLEGEDALNYISAAHLKYNESTMSLEGQGRVEISSQNTRPNKVKLYKPRAMEAK